MPKIPLLPFLKYFTNILFTELTLNFQSLFQHLFQCYSENVLKLDNEKGSNHTLFSSDVISKNNENQKMLCQYYKYEGFGQLCLIYYLQQCNRKKHVCMKSRTFPQNIIIIIFFFYFFFCKKILHALKALKALTGTKTLRQKHKNANKRISDYFPLRYFLGAFFIFVPL